MAHTQLDDRQQVTDRPAAAAARQVRVLNDLLAPAGIRLNGDGDADPRIRDPRAVDQILRRGSLGAGEAYMRGWWDVPRLDETLCRIVRARVDEKLTDWRSLWLLLRAWLTNPQRPSHAFDVGEAHYDLGNDLFEAMLDARMVYSCGYWADAVSLDDAQVAKLDLICRKLGLEAGQRLLDIGCGWGSLCRYAAEEYGVEAVGITVSQEQQALAQRRCRGLPVDIRLIDYRDLDPAERFDHVASVGMIEHVGAKNYRELFRIARRALKPDGLFLLHTIGNDFSTTTTDAWIDRYIFPQGHLPSLAQLSTAAERLFVVEDVHNFGADYDPTLMAWFRNFDAAWPELAKHYGDTFYRMWKYYLLTCAGAFRARGMQVWQLVLAANGSIGGYRRRAGAR